MGARGGEDGAGGKLAEERAVDGAEARWVWRHRGLWLRVVGVGCRWEMVVMVWESVLKLNLRDD